MVGCGPRTSFSRGRRAIRGDSGVAGIADRTAGPVVGACRFIFRAALPSKSRCSRPRKVDHDLGNTRTRRLRPYTLRQILGECAAPASDVSFTIIEKVMSRLLLTTLIALLLILPACDAADDDASGAVGSMSAAIDGTSWKAANATATRVGAMGMNVVTINGATTSGDVLNLNLVNIDGAGDYALTGQHSGSFSPSGSFGIGNGTFTSTGGTVTVEKADDAGLRGFFSFEARRSNDGKTIAVQDGRFNVRYQQLGN